MTKNTNKVEREDRRKFISSMASGGILCEQIQPPHLGHPIETMEFLDNLSKWKDRYSNQRRSQFFCIETCLVMPAVLK